MEKGDKSWPVSHTHNLDALITRMAINGTGSPLIKLDQWFLTEVSQKRLKCQSACCLTLSHDIVEITTTIYFINPSGKLKLSFNRRNRIVIIRKKKEKRSAQCLGFLLKRFNLKFGKISYGVDVQTILFHGCCCKHFKCTRLLLGFCLFGVNCLCAYIVCYIQTNIYAVVLLFNNTFMLFLCEVSLRHSLK